MNKSARFVINRNFIGPVLTYKLSPLKLRSLRYRLSLIKAWNTKKMKTKGKSIEGFLFASLIHQSDILMRFSFRSAWYLMLWFILLISPFAIYSIEFLHCLYVNINKKQTSNQISTPISLSCLLVRGTQRGYSSKPLNKALLSVF